MPLELPSRHHMVMMDFLTPPLTPPQPDSTELVVSEVQLSSAPATCPPVQATQLVQKGVLDEIGDASTDHDAFFVADMGEMTRLRRLWQEKLPYVTPHYAVKCNADPTLISHLASLQTNFDCASISELSLVLSLGVSPKRIIFANPIKTLSSLRYATRHGVMDMTFDNADELYKIASINPAARLFLRIAAEDSSATINFSSKYGARLASIPSLLALAAELDLSIVGVAFHVGTGATDASAYVAAIQDSRRVIDTASRYGHRIQTLDIGGGFSKETFPRMAEQINQALDQDNYFLSKGIRVIAEPGRFLCASAFTLACTVIGRRTRRYLPLAHTALPGDNFALEAVDNSHSNNTALLVSAHVDNDIGSLEISCRESSTDERETDSEIDKIYLSDGIYGSFMNVLIENLKPVPVPVSTSLLLTGPTAMPSAITLPPSPTEEVMSPTEGDLSLAMDELDMLPLPPPPSNTFTVTAHQPSTTITKDPLPVNSTTKTVPLADDINSSSYTYSIWGPTCDSTDLLCPSHTFSHEIKVGDWLCFENMGAYTLATATQFNGLAPPSKIIYVDSEAKTNTK